MKTPIVIASLIISFSVSAAGQRDVSGWDVRWGDVSKYGDVYARIAKIKQLPDIGNKSNIDASIQQDIDNKVSFSLSFNEYGDVKPCGKNTTLRKSDCQS